MKVANRIAKFYAQSPEKWVPLSETQEYYDDGYEDGFNSGVQLWFVGCVAE